MFTGGDIQVLGLELAGHANGLAQDVGVGGGAVVEAARADGDGAAAHVKAGKCAVAHLGGAGGQCGTAGVGEAAAVDLYAIGVGHNHLGTPAIDGDSTVEVARAGGVDFVKNSFGQHAVGKPGVAGGVVEHNAAGGHVKLAVGVAAQARSAGGLDVDQWAACAVAKHSGPLVGRGGGVGNDLSQCHWRTCQHGA